MKKTMLFLLFTLFTASAVFAGETSTDQFNQAGISYAHKHSTDAPQGIGADIVLLKTANPLFSEVTAQTRFDIANSDVSVFLVARVDLFDKLANK